ncbi:hypothetical protein DFA_01800 [Cavenderia fasciculata]|uniref:TmcB/TmcC TPR repeats domain-containing protein n=1 Tax=Cavenderia fasciculata TaxID=261658 RepID=F4PUV2_CACFS|nr:uncharacterized protein DFA_01800 [Cavenderia fasciculata]EGG21914.1 hypothetical protein DFA_01800 [Cavenderia fasciculata]|eukprot:XP_004359765.1 hypothetical protein DFA_01800 [Cavenderia fasciculata]
MSSSRRSSKSRTSGTDSSGSLNRLLNFSKSIEKGIFGVLYAMTKNNTFPKALTIIALIIEFIQLISFGFKSVFPWGGDLGFYLKKIVSPISHPADVLAYKGFTVLFWVAIAFMVLGFINIWYVAYTFYQGKIANIWIIRTLRWFVSSTVAVLYIPLLSLFLIGLNCSKDSESGGGYYLTRFASQDILCYGPENMPITIFSIVFIILFTIIAVCSSVTYYEFDTSVSDRFAKPHARFDLTILLVKTIFAFFFELLKGYPWLLAIVFFIGLLLLSFGSIILLPYNNQRLNQIKSGLYTIVLWVSFCTILTMIVNDTESPATSYLVVAGLIPSFFLGFFLNKLFYKYLYKQLKYLTNVPPQTSVQTMEVINNNNNLNGEKIVKFEEPVTLGSKSQIKFPFFDKWFSMPLFIEIMSRRILASRGGNQRDQAAIDRANLLFQCGLQYYPNSSLLWMAYANYLFTVRQDRHVGYASLEKLRRMNPPFDIRFFIFQRDKEREQMMDSDLRGPSGKIQDFVTYMEFKKLYLGARRSHQSCLNYINRFWRHLLHETIDLNALSTLSGKIATSETRATEQYERLLGLNPNSVRVIRDYAQFVEEVVRDRDHSFKLAKKADTIEDNMSKSLSIEHTRRLSSSIPSDLDIMGDGASTGGIQLERISIDTSAAAGSLRRGEQKTIRIPENSSTQDKKSGGGLSGDDSSDATGSSYHSRSNYAAYQQSNSISRLSWLMIFTTLATVIFAIVVLVVLRNQMIAQRNAFQGVLSLGSLGSESVQVANNFLLMNQYALANNSAGFAYHQHDNVRRINIMENIHRAIYYGEKSPQAYVSDPIATLKRQAGISGVYDIGSVLFSYPQFNKTNPANSALLRAVYNKPVIDMMMLIGTNAYNDNTTDFKYVTQPFNVWKGGNMYVENARVINSYAIDDFGTEISRDPGFRFVTKNTQTLSDSFLLVQKAYVGTILLSANNNSLNILYVWVSIFGLLFILAVLLFRPIVSRISREKIRTLVLFALAPHDLVLKMATKKVKLSNLESGSDRDIQFDLTSGDDEDDQVNNSHSPFSSPSSSSSRMVNKSSSSLLPESSSSSPNILLQGEELTKGGGEDGTAVLDQEDHHLPLLSPAKIVGDSTTTTATATVKKRIGGWDGTSKRNINKRSLRVVLRRLHVSYSFALFLLFGILTMGLFVSFAQIFVDQQAGYDLALCAYRTADSRLLHYYTTKLLSPPDEGDNLQHDIHNTTLAFQKNHQSLIDIPRTEDVMDGTFGCYRIDQSECRQPQDPYYKDTIFGLDWTIEQMIQHSLNLAYENRSAMTGTDPDIVWMNAMYPDISDGLDRTTFRFFEYWQEIQTKALNIITAILSVSTVLLVLIYLILFRPFINRLRVQHIHTLAMLRLAPEDIQFMHVSDKIIDED